MKPVTNNRLWLVPEVGQTYLVPENVENHKSHNNRVGTCVGTRQTGFGMHWALLDFLDDREDVPKQDWIRTSYLEELKFSD
jgi:hypothetical protein